MDYSQRFTRFIPFIFEAETVYAKGHYGNDAYVVTEHDANDSGGTTRYGIDKASHPSTDVEHLTKAQATAIYWQEWQRENVESFPYPFGEAYYDCCVNAGQGRADRILAKTGKDAAAFLAEREAFYRRLADAKPKNKRYLQGWLNRISNLRKFLSL